MTGTALSFKECRNQTESPERVTHKLLGHGMALKIPRWALWVAASSPCNSTPRPPKGTHAFAALLCELSHKRDRDDRNTSGWPRPIGAAGLGGAGRVEEQNKRKTE